MRFTFVLAAAAIAAPLAAQNPRPSTNLHGCTEITFDPAVASNGDISVAAVSAGDSTLGAAHIDVYRSDGRGLTWSGPVQVDADGTGARKDLDDPSYLQVVGGVVHMIWKDDRGADTEVYYSRSTDGGATWSAELLLDKAGHGDTFNARMTVSGSNVYVAYEANEPGGSDDQLLIVSSSDGGLTFGTAVNPSVGGGAGSLVDVDNLDIRADGSTLHVAWSDDRVAGQNGLFYQRSTDGGATFLAADVQLDPGGVHDVTSGRVSLALDGSLVAVGWDAESTGGGNESLFVNTSTDGGATFGGAVMVGAYTDVTDDVDESRLMVSGGNLIAVWEDNRTLSDEIYVATSTDSGATWTEQASSFGIGGFPRVSNISAGDQDGCAVGWTGGTFPECALYAVSTDNGVTFGSTITASDTANDADFAEMVWNDLYNNFVCAWQSDECDDGLGGFFNNTYVGGFRPQTIAANGFVAGAATLNFDVSDFDTATTQCWVVCALGTGDTFIPFGDGRNVGLVQDFVFGVTTMFPGAFNTALDASGGGSTTSQNVTLTSGMTVFAVGVGITPTAPAFGDISDVLQIDVP